MSVAALTAPAVGASKIHRGVVVKAPATPDDAVVVVLPNFNKEQTYPVPPERWMSHAILPVVGEGCLVLFDEEEIPHIVLWGTDVDLATLAGLEALATLTDSRLDVLEAVNPIVTTLPTTGLFDGRVVFLQNTQMATYGAIWHMRYNLAQTRWECIGGRPMRYEANTAFAGLPTGASWQHIGFTTPGSGGSFRPPGMDLASGNLGGMYDINVDFKQTATQAPSTYILIAQYQNGTGTVRANWVQGEVSGSSGQYNTEHLHTRKLLTPTAGEATDLRVWNTAGSGAVTAFYAREASIEFMPVYLEA